MNGNESKSRAVEVMVRMEYEHGLQDELHKMSEVKLESKFNLTRHDAISLWNVIHDGDSDRTVYGLPTEHSEVLREMLVEALHQGLDGYTYQETFVIRAFLSDIGYAVGLVVNSR